MRWRREMRSSRGLWAACTALLFVLFGFWQRGQPVGGQGYIIAADTKIDLLNVQYGESEMTVTIGDDVWKAPYKEAEQSSAMKCQLE